MFVEKEITYFQSQPLARISTVSEDKQPDTAAVIFEYDGTYFYVGGVKPKNTRKYKNVRAGNNQVSLLIDDMESIKPWKPRGIRIYGTADFVERSGQFGSGTYLRITPDVSWSWNIVGPSIIDGRFLPNKIVHTS
ncbi:MAG: PPOX class F420-dependent oxidoreductase [Anaerolineales bacterium]|nr:PPOX class F420-dependent oxidoreductase [Anaerolineales bacterium]